ncbi:hypothetical protein C2845_PM04G07700 [Panicum miliaceum]|uniref:Uncharacterized protein n=1 Tax=Panicum miliaceum TaxID=4540 RepID=A0A3L6QMT1_PANMI|nr:hypothetical protein C2845_PM04G07700 [Panicum miliaceum]
MAPRPKKRSRASGPSGAPDGQLAAETGGISAKLPLPAMDAPDPKPAGAGGEGSRRQEPPVQARGGGRGNAGVNRIGVGDLPDAVLQDIISLLPTKEAGRTPILSSRWRHLWRTAPLILDCLQLPVDLPALSGAVSRILAAHRGPGRCFCVDTRLFHSSPATLDAWLQSPALDGLQELDMCGFRRQNELAALPPLPPSTFRFSRCLRVAALSECTISDGAARAFYFSQMKELELERVSISEASLHRAIAGCPILECLLLGHSVGSRRVRIKSATLRSIGVCSPLLDGVGASTGIVEIIIQDAPSLERLVFPEVHQGLRVSVIAGAAPKLETLGCIYDVDPSSRFVFGSMVIQDLRVVSSSRSVVSSIKVLAINFYRLSLDLVIDLLMCFPCLEKLYIQSYRSAGNNLWRRKHRNLIRSFDIRLKTIVFLRYRGIKSQVSFATFFILNAKLLETMRFEGGPYMEDEDFIARQHELLQVEKRASIGAKIDFATDKCDHYLTHVKHVHDLSITDPFECTCPESLHVRPNY